MSEVTLYLEDGHALLDVARDVGQLAQQVRR